MKIAVLNTKQKKKKIPQMVYSVPPENGTTLTLAFHKVILLKKIVIIKYRYHLLNTEFSEKKSLLRRKKKSNPYG